MICAEFIWNVLVSAKPDTPTEDRREYGAESNSSTALRPTAKLLDAVIGRVATSDRIAKIDRYCRSTI